jgi:hypothetical protein
MVKNKYTSFAKKRIFPQRIGFSQDEGKIVRHSNFK